MPGRPRHEGYVNISTAAATTLTPQTRRVHLEVSAAEPTSYPYRGRVGVLMAKTHLLLIMAMALLEDTTQKAACCLLPTVVPVCPTGALSCIIS